MLGSYNLFHALTIAADEALAALESDSTRRLAVERLTEMLDLLERDPRDRRLRRRRFVDPPVWAVTVLAGREDYVLLWNLNQEQEPVVIYIGRAF